jgi:hypothetical protein
MGSERIIDMWQKIASVFVRISRRGERKQQHLKETEKKLVF